MVVVAAAGACGATAKEREPERAPERAVSVRTTRVGEPGRYINRFDTSASPIVWARAGERLIVSFDPTAEQVAAGELVARLDNGRAVPAPLYLVWPSGSGGTTVGSTSGGSAARWFDGFPGVAGEGASSGWRSLPAERATEMLRLGGTEADAARAFGGWVAVLEIPAEAAGQGLWLASRRVPIGWLLDPPYRPQTADPAGLVPREAHARLLETLRPALASPLLRWRARLTLRAAGFDGWRTAGAMSDPIVERLAQQIEDEWTFGLEALTLDRPELEGQLRERIAGLIVLASTPEEPAARATVAWDPEQTGLERIKQLLLQSGVSANERVGGIENWLEAEPATGAWVIDDAGMSDVVAGRTNATIGLVRLGGSTGEAAAFAQLDGDERASSVFALRPGRMASILVPGRVPARDRVVGREDGGRITSAPSTINIGTWRSERRLIDRALPVKPPGLVIGQLTDDWTLSTWWTSAMATPRDAKVSPSADGAPFAALLTRGTGRAVRQDVTPSQQHDGWTVYVEADVRGDGSTSLEVDEVRVWIGPPFAPTAVCTVRSDGTFDTSGPAGSNLRVEIHRWENAVSGSAGQVRVTSGDERSAESSAAGNGASAGERANGQSRRWSAWIRLPESCLEQSASNRSTLRLGIDRTDPSGVRSAWPRPMTPWQREPGRLLLDLSEWGGVDRADSIRRP